jgi:hypothetical protein
MPWDEKKARASLRVLNNLDKLEGVPLSGIPEPKAPPSIADALIDDDYEEDVTFHCLIVDAKIVQPCGLRNCVLWTSHEEWYNCAGAYAAMKSASAGERLSSKTTPKREFTVLQEALDGRLSYVDLALLYRVSRQRVEEAVEKGRNLVGALIPLLRSGVDKETATRHSAADALTPVFTSTGHAGLLVCVACEERVGDERDYTLGANGAVWCSPECRDSLPISAWSLTKKHGAHWAHTLARACVGAKSSEDVTRKLALKPKKLARLVGFMARQGFSVPKALTTPPVSSKATEQTEQAAQGVQGTDENRS